MATRRSRPGRPRGSPAHLRRGRRRGDRARLRSVCLACVRGWSSYFSSTPPRTVLCRSPRRCRGREWGLSRRTPRAWCRASRGFRVVGSAARDGGATSCSSTHSPSRPRGSSPSQYRVPRGLSTTSPLMSVIALEEMHAKRARFGGAEHGFTLIEILVVIIVMGVSPLSSWTSGRRQYLHEGQPPVQ